MLGCSGREPEPTSWSAPELLVEGSSFHGIHGLTFDADDRLFAGSVIGQAIYHVDPQTGEVDTVEAPPLGMADDLEHAADGTLVWTSFLLGKVHARSPGGEIEELASGLAGANSLAFRDDGRLFMTQVFAGDALWELDREGGEPRLVAEAMGGLNGFDFGPDGFLYGPLWFKGEVVRVDVDSGVIETVARGFQIPAAANFDSRGRLWVVDTKAGQVVRVDVTTGEKTLVAEVSTSIDNLAIDSSDRLFISNMADNGIYEIDTETGSSRTVVEGELAIPGGIGIADDGTIWVADLFAVRSVDPSSGVVTDRARAHDDAIEYPDNLAVGPDAIWLSSFVQGAVQKFDPESGLIAATWHGLPAPIVVLPDPEGGALVGLATGEIVRLSEPGQAYETLVLDLVMPIGLAWAPNGDVYAVQAGAGTIVRIDLQSGSTTEIAADLHQPEGLAIGLDGRLIVAEVGLQSVLSIDPESGTRQVIADGLPIGLKAPAGLPPTFIPTGVAVSSDGTIYVSSDLENAIYTIRPQRRN